MALILNIDTATENASISLCNDEEVLAVEINTVLNSHASFLQPAIQKITTSLGISLHQLNAIAVTNGPGSYTGLRIGLSSAKGLCFALQKPLITINTLEVMALATIHQCTTKATLHCPMIDARRLEVFTATYHSDLKEIVKPSALILDNGSFETLLNNNEIIFSGSGALKTKELIKHPNAQFSKVVYNISDATTRILSKYKNKDFSDVSTASPNYFKAFYMPIKQKK